MSEFTLFVGALIVVYLLPGPGHGACAANRCECRARSSYRDRRRFWRLREAAHVAFAGLGLAALFDDEPHGIRSGALCRFRLSSLAWSGDSEIGI